MPKKKNWDEHRDEIERLYIEEGWKLSDVAKYMGSERGFNASEISYQRQLRLWGVRKNIVGWDAIAIAYEQRRLGGKDTRVIISEKRVSTDRVKKQIRRHITTAKIMDIRHGARPTPLNMPFDVKLRTPSPGLSNIRIYTSCGMGSPWITYFGSLLSLGIQGFETRTMAEPHGSGPSEPIRVLDLVRGEDYTSRTQEMGRVSSTALDLRALIPEAYDGQHLKTAEALCDGSRAWPYEEIMVQLFLLANNFLFQPDIRFSDPQSMQGHDKRITALLHQLGRTGLEHVKPFLTEQNPTAEAIRQQLFASILRSEDKALLQFILSTGVNVNAVVKTRSDGLANFPLTLAASIDSESKSLYIVSLLIDAGADVNLLLWKSSALDAAVRNGHVDVAKKLLENKARAYPDSLEFAIMSGSEELLQLILDAGADVNSKLTMRAHGLTPIGLVAQQGHVKMAQMLIKEGADINAMQSKKCILSSGCAGNDCLRACIVTTALGIALSKGHLDVAQVLLEHADMEINHLSVNQYICPLLVACDRGYEDIAIKLLDVGADVCAADASGMALECRPTTLLSAIIRRQHGNINMDFCKVLISKGARLDHALLEAARSNSCELVTFLLSRGARSSVSDSGFEQTALGCAIEEGLVDMAEFLYDAGITDVGSPSRIKDAGMVTFLQWTELLPGILRANGQTIFCDAVRQRDDLLLDQLMVHDDEIDFSQEPKLPRAYAGSFYPLDVAVDFGELGLIRYLRSRGAIFGRLTLRRAVEHDGAKYIVDALLSSLPPTWGPDDIEPRNGPVGPYHFDGDDPPALIRAAQLGDRSILQTLLDVVDWGHQHTGKALTAAILSGNYDLAQDLRCAGASLEEAWRRDGWSPNRASALSAAVDQKNVELVTNLIEAGANVNKPAGNCFVGRTALQLAAEIGHLKLVEVLLGAGADVNAPPGLWGGATALQCAAIGGHLEIAQRLLHDGADVNAEGSDDDGRTALEGAAEHGRLEMVYLLLERGAGLTGVYESQYIHAVEFAKENGHNAVAKFLESVRLNRTERQDWSDSDDHLAGSHGKILGEDSAIASQLGCEQKDEERDTSGATLHPALTPGEEFRMPSESQRPQENMETDWVAPAGGEGCLACENDESNAMPSMEHNWEIRLLEDTVIGKMIQGAESVDGIQSQIQDGSSEFTVAGPLPTADFQGEGWQFPLASGPDFQWDDMVYFDKGIDFNSGWDVEASMHTEPFIYG